MSDTNDLIRRLTSIAELMEDEGIGRGDWCDAPTVREAIEGLSVLESQLNAATERAEAWRAIAKGTAKLKDYVRVGEPVPAGKVQTGEAHGQQVMPKVNGQSFRCDCGCNVFTEIEPNHFACNSCHGLYEGIKR